MVVKCIVAALTKVEACVAEVADWGRGENSTEVEQRETIIFPTVKRVDLPAEISLTTAGHRVIPKSSARTDSKVILLANTKYLANSVKHS